jgi:hypothetical protein
MTDVPMSHDSFFTWSLTTGWQPIAAPPIPEGMRLDTWLMTQGYVFGYAPDELLLMHNIPGRLAVWYYEKAPQPHRYIVALDLPGEDVAIVFLEGVPALMDYLRLYSVAPLLTLAYTLLERRKIQQETTL